MLLRDFTGVCVLIAVMYIPAHAQSTGSVNDGQRAQHVVYFDGLGMTLLPGISYERKLNPHESVRLGIGYFESDLVSQQIDLGHSHGDDTPRTKPSRAMASFPVSYHYLAAQSDNQHHSLELGAGATLMLGASGAGIKYGDNPLIGFDDSVVAGVLSTLIAYRYEPVRGGLFVRIGLVPALAISSVGTQFTSLPNVSIGYAFSR